MVNDTSFLITTLLLYVAIIGFFIFCWCRIWSKAGFSGAWALLMIIPIVGLGAFLYLVFADWPIEKKTIDTDTFR